MANFVTADDQRIFELQTQTNPTLDFFFPVDFPGQLAATKLSLTRLLNLISLNQAFPRAYAGNVNPDNALGLNGDLYFTVPADAASLQLFQKINEAWALVFNLPLNTSVTADLTFTAGDLQPDGFGGFYLPVNVPAGKKIVAIQYTVGTQVFSIDSSFAIKDTAATPNTTISNFPNNGMSSISVTII